MNAIEKIKNADEDDLAKMFCSLVNAVASIADIDLTCDICPVSKQCELGKLGFIPWLNESGEMNFNKFIIGYIGG